jgi:glycerate dehydrogenase
MKAAFLDYDTVSNGDLDTAGLRSAVDELVLFDLDESRSLEQMRDADIVLINKLALNRELLHGAPKLKLVTLAATGTNNVDLVAARERGIGVCNLRAYCTSSVAQHAWALILSLTQHIPEYSRVSRDGSWVKDEAQAVLAHPIRELNGRIFAVIGWGELGKATARIAEAFGMRVVIANRPGAPRAAGRLDLDDLLIVADIVSLHCPLTDDTRGMIGARELALMKPEALLINTARGALIDSAALAAALQAGLLGGAGLDVLPEEPPVHGNPLLDLDIPNLLVTPHVAWSAREARQRCLDEMAENIRDFRRGGRRGRVV